jgi:hypothetical protein
MVKTPRLVKAGWNWLSSSFITPECAVGKCENEQINHQNWLGYDGIIYSNSGYNTNHSCYIWAI